MRNLFILLCAVLLFVPPIYATDAALVGTASLFDWENPLFKDKNSKVGMIIPVVMLFLVIVFMLIDFGTIGVTMGAMVTLILTFVVGILPITVTGVISMIVMGFILIYKLRA